MTPNNPYIRILAGLIAVAVAIRVIFELLAPVYPYLLGAVVLLGLIRIVHWWRNRW